jgi:serralysin
VTVSLAQTVAQNTVGAGTDTLATIEHLTGSAFSDTLTGSTGANRIAGGAGNDTINGGTGNDTLAGGVGADSFVFNSSLGASNVDSIFDFSVVDDTIHLENTGIFAALTTTGVLAASAFQTGSTARDADDRIIYDSATGRLLYDVDGSGGQAAVQFAVLSTGLSLTNADFLVI